LPPEHPLEPEGEFEEVGVCGGRENGAIGIETLLFAEMNGRMYAS